MNQQTGPILGVIARGGATGPSPLSVIDPASPTWATDLFRSRPAATAIVFVPQLEGTPRIGQGTQLDELLPEHSPQVAVVPMPTHVTGVLAAVQDCLPLLGSRAEFIAAVRAHAARSYAGAWLKRVAKLDAPSPSLLQHLRSWLPFTRGQFVGIHPALTVQGRPERPPQPLSTPVLRTSAEPSGRVSDVLGAAYAPQHREMLPTAHRLAARWGTDQAVEYVVTPEPAALRLPPPDGRCPTCGDPVWGQCAFCHLTTPNLEHWRSVSVPGVAPVAPEPEPIPQPAAVPEPQPKRAFQLPRHRPTAENPWVHSPRG